MARRISGSSNAFASTSTLKRSRLTVLQMIDQGIASWMHLDHPNVSPLHGVYWYKKRPLPALVIPWYNLGNLTAYVQSRAKDMSDSDAEDLIFSLVRNFFTPHAQVKRFGSSCRFFGR